MSDKFIKCPECNGKGMFHMPNGEPITCQCCAGVGYLELVTEEVNEPMNVKVDPINPNHYKNSTSLECIEAMEIIFGAKAVIDFCICNAWKYIWRWKNKNGFEDLDKAKWYIDKAWDLIDENLVISEKKNILIRMGAYIEDIERDQKKEDE